MCQAPDRSPPRPSGRAATWGRRRLPPRLAFAVVAFLLGATLLGNTGLSALYVVYQRQLGFPAWMLTAVYATYAASVLATLVVAGRVSDRVGRRRAILPAVGILVAGTVTFILADAVVWLVVGRVLQGVGTGILLGAATAALVELDPDGDEARAALATTLAFVAGAALGPLVFGALAQFTPWPTVAPFLLEASLLVGGLTAALGLPETVAEAGAATTPPRRVPVPAVPAELRGAFLLAATAIGLAWSVNALYAALGPSLASRVFHEHSRLLGGGTLFVYFLAGGTGQVGLRRLVTRHAVMLGGTLLGVGIVLVSLALAVHRPGPFVVGTVAAGLGSGVCFLGGLTLINQTAPPDRRAELVSAYNMVGYLALALPVLGVGALTGIIGLLTTTLVFAGVVVSAAGLAVAGAARYRHQHPTR
ncbi:MAG TPA: MFS transporter [Acidimicrobiales bacterium]|nr:MFS transporter [Acidimicrobiales bacterium]